MSAINWIAFAALTIKFPIVMDSQSTDFPDVAENRAYPHSGWFVRAHQAGTRAGSLIQGRNFLNSEDIPGDITQWSNKGFKHLG